MIVLGNCSTLRQVRWTDCIVPNKDAEAIPPEGMWAGVLFQKAGKRPCGTTIHCLVDLQGDAVFSPFGKPVAAKFIPAISKLCPDPAKLQLELQVGNQRGIFVFIGLTGQGTHRLRFHFRATVMGFHADLWATVWSFQDLIDICGRITWSDRSNPSHWSPVAGETVRIHAQQGNWHIDYSTRWGINSGGFGITPLDGLYPDAMSFPFYGFWSPTYPACPPPDDPMALFWQLRRDSAEAAKQGPIEAKWSVWDGKWFGANIPPVARNTGTTIQELARFRQRLTVPGEITDAREFASPLNTGQTGDTNGFGYQKDYLLLHDVDPRRIWQLRESTVDYLMRAHHNFEANGQPITYDNHQGLMTWHLAKFHTGDLLGKATETPGPPHAYGRPFVDDEHRGDLFIAAVRHVTDDPLLQADLFDRTEMDKGRAFRKNKWIAAPRAAGRLWQSWAMAWWTTDSDVMRKELHQLAIDEFNLRKTHLQTPTGNLERAKLGPVRPFGIIGTDTRVIDGGPAWMPWNDACGLAGLWHQITLWDGEGNDKPLAEAMRAYWLEIATTILKYAVVRAADGQLYPLNGVLWRPNGEPNGDTYYTFPRQGASFGDDAYDMLVGTHGWFTTLGWPTVVSGYLTLYASGDGGDPVALQNAKEIQSKHYANPSVKTAEWLVR